MSGTSFFRTGGTLPRDAPSYVVRTADTALFAALQAGEFCYVLTARQMGKSSLMVRTASRLQAEAGRAVAVVDLTALGQNLSPEQWYAGQLRRMGRQLGLEDELNIFYSAPAHAELGPFQRWMLTLEAALLPRLSQPLVLFIDEIDIVLSLPFSTDEFFAGIRECYNRRTSEPALRQLTFCLLGVATPSELIQDTRNTPFNIGHGIELADFTPSEALPLTHGLADPKASRKLQSVLHWSGGHPYLTQRLCQALVEHPTGSVERLCQELFLSPTAQERDDNLVFVRERVLRGDVDRVALLELYQKILSGRRVPDTQGSHLTGLLRLSGLVTRDREGNLRPRNRLYQAVFNKKWIKDHLPSAEKERQKQAFRRGLLLASLVAGSIITSLSVFAYKTIQAEEKVRNHLFISDMLLAQQALENGDLKQVKKLLEKHGQDPQERDRVEYGFLANQIDTSLEQLEGLPPDLLALKVLPDGTRLIGSVKRLEWWSSDGKSRGGISLPKRVKAISFCSKKRCGVLLTDDEILLWQGEKDLKSLPSLSKHHWTVALSPDGKFVAVASAERKIGLLDITHKKWLWQDQINLSVINTIEFFPDSQSLAIGGNIISKEKSTNGIIKIIDVHKNTFKDIHSQYKSISKLCVTPDEQSLAITDKENISIINLNNLSEIELYKSLYPNTIHTLNFSPDSKKLAWGGDNQKLVCLDIRYSFLTELRGHTDSIKSITYLSNNTLLSAGEDGNLKKWQNIEHVPPLKSSDNSVALSQDGKLAARQRQTETSDYSVELTSLTNKYIKIKKIQTKEIIFAQAFSPDGSLLATGNTQGSLALWRISDGRCLWQKEPNSVSISAIAWSPDGKHIASGYANHDLRIHSIFGEQEKFITLANPNLTSEIYPLSFLSKENIVIYNGIRSGMLSIWNLVQKAPNQVPFDQKDISTMALSPDGQTLATASTDHTIALRDPHTGKRTHPLLTTTTATVHALEFSKDSRSLIAASDDKQLQFYDTLLGSEVYRWKYLHEITHMRMSPTGSSLIVTGHGAGFSHIPLAISKPTQVQ